MHSYGAAGDEGRNGQPEGQMEGRVSPGILSLRDRGRQQNTNRRSCKREQ